MYRVRCPDRSPESVHNLRPTTSEHYIRSPRYRSKYAEEVVRVLKASKRPHRTFGVPHLPLDSPELYLRKASKHNTNGIPLKPTCVPPVPLPPEGACKVDTWQHVNPHPLSRDMIGRTKRAVLALKPKDPCPITVDQRNGNKYRLEKSGLVPCHVVRPNYGKIPKYVKHYRKIKLAKYESDFYAARGAERLALDSQFMHVTEDDRQDIIRNLKRNFAEAMHQFQGLSVVLDNETKRRTKTNLEKTLNELEKSIELVSRRKNIFVKQEQYGRPAPRPYYCRQGFVS